jgi:hypothetical protein
MADGESAPSKHFVIATGTYSDASTRNITNSVTWTSSKTLVATITAAGLANLGDVEAYHPVDESSP